MTTLTTPERALINQLVAGRLAARLTKVEVANRLGVSAAALGQWESGTSRPGLATAFRWARALGRDIALTDPTAVITAWAYSLPPALTQTDGPLVELMGATTDGSTRAEIA